MSLRQSQALDVAEDCIRYVTGSKRPLNLQEGLDKYGVFTQNQCSAIRYNIVANGVIGVPRFAHSINPQALGTLNNGWTVLQLASVVLQFAQANSSIRSFALEDLSAENRTALANTKLREISELLADLPQAGPETIVKLASFEPAKPKTLQERRRKELNK